MNASRITRRIADARLNLQLAIERNAPIQEREQHEQLITHLKTKLQTA